MAVLTSALAGAQKLSTISGSASVGTTGRQALADSLVPEIAESQKIAAVDPSTVISFTVALQPRDLAGLQAFADSVSDPTSPNYRHFITPSQVGDRFGASAADRQAVVAYLASKGITVTLVAASGLAISATGTAANVQNAFSTTLATFEGPDDEGNTITYRANATALTLPASIVSLVTCVSGVETHTRPKPRATTATLTPGFISSAYNITPSMGAGYYGQGRTVAISNFDGFNLTDAKSYVSNYGLMAPSAGVLSNVSVVTVGTGAMNGTAQGEGDLDIQMVIGQAPLANIRIYDNGTGNRLGVITQEANDNVADVITESYGWPGNASTYNSWHTIQLQFTAQGQTYMAASGDSSTHVSSAPYPDFDPEVLMVGGSITTVDSSTGARVGDVAWTYTGTNSRGQATAGGSGGGWYNSPAAVTFNTLPSWQKGTGVPTTINRRLFPDISFQAGADNKDISNDSTANGGVYAYLVYQGTQYFTEFDGTSCASPMLAGMLATTEGRLALNTTGTVRLGRLQDAIYAQNGRSDVYHDITVGTAPYALPSTSTGTSNSYTGTIPTCTPGWDYLTGWGTMDLTGFYNSLLPVAHVSMTLGSFTGDPTTIPVVVEFRTPGTTTDVSVQTVYPAADGTITITAPGVGTYDVAIKASHWLRRTTPSVAFAVNSTTSLSVSLINGDVNGDNYVTAADRAAVTVALGTSVGQSGYSANADLNGDGYITAADRAIVTVNLGQIGDN